MSRNEFIMTMRSALTGKVPANVIEENIRYYEEYISQQLRQGKTESEIMAELGDPRLLAKTIVEANKHSETTGHYAEERTVMYDGEENSEDFQGQSLLFRFIHAPKWFQVLLMCVIAFVVITVVGTILGMLFPFIVIGLLVAFVISRLK